MKFLLLNQTFHPDVVSTAQHLTDLARALTERGHQVSVIAGRRAYDNPATVFPARESWSGIAIARVGGTSLGKGAKWRRGCDFLTFLLACAVKLLFTPRPDVIVALTSPPLISVLGAAFARLRGCRFVYWVMDLNPDEAIAAGWLKEKSLLSRALQQMSIFSFRSAAISVVLDRFMRERVQGISTEKVAVLPPWSHDAAVRFDAHGREEFRRAHGLTDKFVVMYSGNHSPCHPLATLLEAARGLAGDERLVFCFVGGGSEFARVRDFAAAHRLKNIFCWPYQPLDRLSGSLSAADLHVVVMGGSFIGTIHPCKIYNILSIGSPVLYFGPEESHLGDILRDLHSPLAVRVSNGDVAGAIAAIRAAAGQGGRGDAADYRRVAARFSQQQLLPALVSILETAAGAGGEQQAGSSNRAARG